MKQLAFTHRRAVLLVLLIGLPLFCLAAKPTRPLLPAPSEVRLIAEQYVAGLPRSMSQEQSNQVRADFIWFFLEGFTSSVGAVSESDAVNKGFEAGQNYRRLNPEKLDRTMAGFGYRAINLQGFWKTDFELSAFVPAAQPSTVWWMKFSGDSFPSRSNFSPDECHNIQISGFLSPAGHYGHMGAFTRQVFVEGIKCVKRAEDHSSRTHPHAST